MDELTIEEIEQEDAIEREFLPLSYLDPGQRARWHREHGCEDEELIAGVEEKKPW